MLQPGTEDMFKRICQLSIITLMSIFSAVLFFASGAFANSKNNQLSGWREFSINSGGLTRWFRIYIPASFAEGAPAVFLLHGGTQSMRKIFNDHAGGTNAWIPIADREGILLVVPNGVNPKNLDTHGDHQNWNDLRGEGKISSGADDVAFLRDLAAWTKDKYHYDPHRLYVTGASNGGMMTFRLLIEASDLFAGGAAIIANLPSRDNLPVPSRPVPLMIVNGTNDPFVLWNGGQVAYSRGETRSTKDTVSWWVKENNANPVAQEKSMPDLDPTDGCHLSLTAYSPNTGGAPVYLYTVYGGGHSMPSLKYEFPAIAGVLLGKICKDVEGAELCWDFFEQNAPAKVSAFSF
jgi:polyhydroxybutyrate depolymerase